MTGDFGSRPGGRWVQSRYYPDWEWLGRAKMYRHKRTHSEKSKAWVRENVAPRVSDWHATSGYRGWEYSHTVKLYRRRATGLHPKAEGYEYRDENWMKANPISRRESVKTTVAPDSGWNASLDFEGWEVNHHMEYRRLQGSLYVYRTHRQMIIWKETHNEGVWRDSLQYPGWEFNSERDEFRRPQSVGGYAGYEFRSAARMMQSGTEDQTTTEGEDVSGDFKTPLAFKKDDLVGRLEETLSANEAEREVKRSEAAAKTAESKAKLDEYLERYPELLVFVADQIRRNFGHGLNDAGLSDTLAGSYPVANAEGLDEKRDPDAELKRLIAALKLSSNETVELEVTNAAYKYIGTGPVETA